MTGRSRSCRPAPAPQTNVVEADAAPPAQRYDITICGVYRRTISGDAAKTTFRRWSERPDVTMRGDLLAGFFWEWPDEKRTRIEIVPRRGQGNGNFTDNTALPTDAEPGHAQHGAVVA